MYHIIIIITYYLYNLISEIYNLAMDDRAVGRLMKTNYDLSRRGLQMYTCSKVMIYSYIYYRKLPSYNNIEICSHIMLQKCRKCFLTDNVIQKIIFFVIVFNVFNVCVAL